MFLEKLGLNDLSELPPLADFVPGPEIMAGLENSLQAAPAGAETTEPEPAAAE
jgi:hypothetical protein